MTPPSSLGTALPRPATPPAVPERTQRARTAALLALVALIAAASLVDGAFSQALSTVAILFGTLALLLAVVALLQHGERRRRNRRQQRIARVISAGIDGAQSVPVESPAAETRLPRRVAAGERLR